MPGTNSKVFFTSDLHFSHINAVHFHPERLLKFGMTMDEFDENKQVASAKYDELLISEWNEKITRQDTVYILGDVCLGNKERAQYIVSKLHGRKFLILGNHDKSMKGLENYFEWVGDIKEAKFTNNQYKYIDPEESFCVEMCHYPLLTWNRRPHGTVMVHGHVHGVLCDFNKMSNELRVDVGYDAQLSKECGGFVELEDLYKFMRAKLGKAGVNKFEDYIDWKMKNDGFRM